MLSMRFAFRLLGIGWLISFLVLGGGIAGFVLDKWVGTDPIFTLAGILVGVIIVMGIFRMLISAMGTTEYSNDRSQK